MRKTIATITLVISMLALSWGTALAGGPVVKACFGKDMSHYARYGLTAFGEPVEPGRGFGHFHYFFAQVVFHGMGEPVQIHMSGSVPPGVLDVYNCGE
jgi:hypothetical protein